MNPIQIRKYDVCKKSWKKNAIVERLKNPESLFPFVCTILTLLIPTDAMNRHEYAH